MRNKAVVTRYTEAYVSYALPKIGLEQIVKDMHDLRVVLREAPELPYFFKAPEVSLEDKIALIEKTLAEVLSVETRDFIEYLIHRKRIDLIVEIAERIRIQYSHGEVVDVVMESTFPLDLDVIERVKAALAKRMNKAVNLYLKLDPDLLGGVRVRVGNKVIDGSLRGKLEDMKKQLMRVQVTE